jgi:thiol-disulfide isomerase/thioredoxin
MKRIALVCSLVALATIRLSAAEAAATGGHTIDNFKLGAHIDGPEITLANAKGKAVLIEQWGIHCGPCLASLPKIEKISRRYKDRMMVFGAHAQQATPDEVKAVVKKNRLSYTIADNMQSPIQTGGIPHVFLFDTTGALIYHGHPADKDFEKMVRKAVAAAPAAGAATGARPSGLDSLRKPGT